MTGRRREARAPLARPRAVFTSALALAILLVVSGGAQAAAGAAQVEKKLPALAPSPNDGLSRALANGDLTEAEYALERALSLFRPDRARRLYGAVSGVGPREATPILRDLAARLRELSPRQRSLAERILARPTSRRDAIHPYRARARRVCGRNMCFWWVTRTVDAPPLADRNRNGVPDYVDKARAVFGTVWNKEVRGLGYRRPRSDRTSRDHGPNGKLDVYVADLGAQGLYGYCTSDDPAKGRRRAVSAYCVVDDDFSRRQFRRGAAGTRALRVTAAHEFFHAVQYAYDWLEDLWLMEGTAAWIEDEVYDGVNDNVQYLSTSPVSARNFWFPLDFYNRDPRSGEANFKYGAWIFWRYLSERFGRDIVRSVWRRADSRPPAPNEYSLQATVSALALRGHDFATVLSDFAVANTSPATAYSEGASYPAPQPTTKVFNAAPATDVVTRVPMFHLSSDYYAFVPSGLSPTARLTITLDLPPLEAAPRASALVHRPDGVVRVPAAVDPTGAGTIVVDNFGSASKVVLVLTNASTRFACWQRAVFSCRGRPLDDTDFFFQAAVS